MATPDAEVRRTATRPTKAGARSATHRTGYAACGGQTALARPRQNRPHGSHIGVDYRLLRLGRTAMLIEQCARCEEPTTMLETTHITHALACHAEWKDRLREAINTGASDWDVASAQLDDQCRHEQQHDEQHPGCRDS